MSYRQERPHWCPHTECIFLRRAQDALCVGQLPAPVLHDETPNTHRLCINAELPVFDLQFNDTDAEYFRWMLDAADGKQTSWLSRRGTA